MDSLGLEHTGEMECGLADSIWASSPQPAQQAGYKTAARAC
jgi:hypothetical protein